MTIKKVVKYLFMCNADRFLLLLLLLCGRLEGRHGSSLQKRQGKLLTRFAAWMTYGCP
jgi:hypothetical protein